MDKVTNQYMITETENDDLDIFTVKSVEPIGKI